MADQEKREAIERIEDLYAQEKQLSEGIASFYDKRFSLLQRDIRFGALLGKMVEDLRDRTIQGVVDFVHRYFSLDNPQNVIELINAILERFCVDRRDYVKAVSFKLNHQNSAELFIHNILFDTERKSRRRDTLIMRILDNYAKDEQNIENIVHEMCGASEWKMPEFIEKMPEFIDQNESETSQAIQTASGSANDGTPSRSVPEIHRRIDELKNQKEAIERKVNEVKNPGSEFCVEAKQMLTDLNDLRDIHDKMMPDLEREVSTRYDIQELVKFIVRVYPVDEEDHIIGLLQFLIFRNKSST